MNLPICRYLVLCSLLACAPAAWGQTTFDGSSLALKSTGSDLGGDWTLDENGYVGTYITLPAPGDVTITAQAAGQAGGDADPRMNIVLADTKAGFDVAAGFNDYQHTFALPAGTYFVRTELNNDVPTANRELTVRSLTVEGATVSNTNSDSNALAAADTYIEHFRKGNVKVGLSGLAPGTMVDVRLKRHAFNFGTAIPNSFTDTFLSPPGSPGRNANADEFQQALADSRFNSLTPENAGKWANNEQTRDLLTADAFNPNGGPNIPYIDRISDYAQEHDMRFRQHNMLWGANSQGGNSQQPFWAWQMIQNPDAIDSVSGDVNSVALRDEISERIEYYIADRANRYYEVDVYNESYHTGSNNPGDDTYWDLYGAEGIAGIYKEAKDAAGPNVRLYVNEYSVLQEQGGDYYGDWYMRHFEDIQNAGQEAYGEDVVGGIGFQYYASQFSHDPARNYAVMNNLAVQGLPMHLTEFGVSSFTSNETTQAEILEEALRLVFGMPGTTGFTMWGFWAGSVWSGAPNGVLYNSDWSLREAGERWQALQNQWHTEESLLVGPDGTIDFTGFFGDYEVTINGRTYDLLLTKGDASYSLVIAPGDYNGDGTVNAGDYTVWRDTLGSESDLRADGNGNLVIDSGDYEVWKSLFGTTYDGAGSGATGSADAAAAVPEPGTAMLLLVGCALLAAAAKPRAAHPPRGWPLAV